MHDLEGKQPDNPWKETVKDIFDELHFGKDSVFRGQRRLACRVVGMIEERHYAYFCVGHPSPEEKQA